MRVHSCTLFCLILSLDFSKGVMGRLIRRAVVVWWFIKGLSSSILIYISILLLINLQNHYYCPSLQMWQPEGFLALQGVTAPPCGLFFRHFIHISMGKSFDCFVYIVYIVVVILHIDFIVFLLLILSGDVELNPRPVNGRNRQCHVLYSNIRGLHGNLHDLIVASKGFDILLCSETLVSNFRHIAELSIPGFKRPILLKHNEINRAQGMAVYIRSGCSASHKASFECGCHETQIIKVCGKHNNFYLFSVYRNPDADDGIFDCLLVSMAAIQENDRKASFVFIGDFNAHHKEWLNSVSNTDCHGLRALDFSSESGCDQIIHNSTHRSGNCLDLIFTDTPGVVAGNVGSPVGTSDHCYVSAIIKTEHAVPDISFSCKIYLKSQADWDGILMIFASLTGQISIDKLILLPL